MKNDVKRKPSVVRFVNQEDVCPLCGSDDLSYPNGGELMDVQFYYDTVCCKCGAEWTQWYNLVYDGNTGITDDDGTPAVSLR